MFPHVILNTCTPQSTTSKTRLAITVCGRARQRKLNPWPISCPLSTLSFSPCGLNPYLPRSLAFSNSRTLNQSSPFSNRLLLLDCVKYYFSANSETNLLPKRIKLSLPVDFLSCTGVAFNDWSDAILSRVVRSFFLFFDKELTFVQQWTVLDR